MRYPFFMLVCIFLLQAGCGGDESPKPVPKDDKKAKPIEPEGPGGGKMR